MTQAAPPLRKPDIPGSRDWHLGIGEHSVHGDRNSTKLEEKSIQMIGLLLERSSDHAEPIRIESRCWSRSQPAPTPSPPVPGQQVALCPFLQWKEVRKSPRKESSFGNSRIDRTIESQRCRRSKDDANSQCEEEFIWGK